MTLLELTVVIATLLALVTTLFIGSRAWKRGSDRAGCIMNLYNVQMATRSYQNLYGYNYGGHPYAENGTQNIAELLFNKGYIEQKLYDEVRGVTKCPSGGTYECAVPDIFPDAGHLYISCSLSISEDHTPHSHSEW
jgi:hypothetical protein